MSLSRKPISDQILDDLVTSITDIPGNSTLVADHGLDLDLTVYRRDDVEQLKAKGGKFSPADKTAIVHAYEGIIQNADEIRQNMAAGPMRDPNFRASWRQEFAVEIIRRIPEDDAEKLYRVVLDSIAQVNIAATQDPGRSNLAEYTAPIRYDFSNYHESAIIYYEVAYLTNAIDLTRKG